MNTDLLFPYPIDHEEAKTVSLLIRTVVIAALKEVGFESIPLPGTDAVEVIVPIFDDPIPKALQVALQSARVPYELMSRDEYRRRVLADHETFPYQGCCGLYVKQNWWEW